MNCRVSCKEGLGFACCCECCRSSTCTSSCRGNDTYITCGLSTFSDKDKEESNMTKESNSAVITKGEVINKSMSKDTFIENFMEIAEAIETSGAPCSVCDSCERTYPSEWVDICSGVCPFCGQPHTIGDNKPVYTADRCITDLKNLTTTLVQDMESSIGLLVIESKLAEKKKILEILEIKRAAINAERGGKYSNKQYLQKHNTYVEVIDEIIKEVSR